MKIRGISRRNIYLTVILILIAVFLLITQACSGPSVTSSRTTVTTTQTLTQTATMITNATTSATTNSTTTKITTSTTQPATTMTLQCMRSPLRLLGGIHF